jgi:hypothetical protein
MALTPHGPNLVFFVSDMMGSVVVFDKRYSLAIKIENIDINDPAARFRFISMLSMYRAKILRLLDGKRGATLRMRR